MDCQKSTSSICSCQNLTMLKSTKSIRLWTQGGNCQLQKKSNIFRRSSKLFLIRRRSSVREKRLLTLIIWLLNSSIREIKMAWVLLTLIFLRMDKRKFSAIMLKNLRWMKKQLSSQRKILKIVQIIKRFQKNNWKSEAYHQSFLRKFHLLSL